MEVSLTWVKTGALHAAVGPQREKKEVGDVGLAFTGRSSAVVGRRTDTERTDSPPPSPSSLPPVVRLNIPASKRGSFLPRPPSDVRTGFAGGGRRGNRDECVLAPLSSPSSSCSSEASSSLASWRGGAKRGRWGRRGRTAAVREHSTLPLLSFLIVGVGSFL